MSLVVKKKQRWPLIVGVMLFIGGVVAAGWFLYQFLSTTPQSVQPPPPTPPHIESISSKMLYTGNVYWGRYMNAWSMKSDLKTAYPFSRLNEFGRENYNAWIGGLECPTVAGVHLTSDQEEATLSFNCSPDYLPEATKWFDAFSLANNHTDNQGVEGFEETKQQLDKVGIQYFGHYDPRALDDLCEIIRVEAKAVYSNNTTQPSWIPIALCGYHGVFRIPTEESLAVMERYAEYMPVIALPHAGAEYKAEPDALKTGLYRSMIDHGADAVIGDHPHWVQTTEAYNGKLIVYSMGNFIFDQQFNQEVTRSAAIELELTVTNTPEELRVWETIAKTCETYHDSCLQAAQQQQLPELKATFQWKVVPSVNTDRLTHPADPTQAARILERLRWHETINALEVPQSGV